MSDTFEDQIRHNLLCGSRGGPSHTNGVFYPAVVAPRSGFVNYASSDSVRSFLESRGYANILERGDMKLTQKGLDWLEEERLNLSKNVIVLEWKTIEKGILFLFLFGIAIAMAWPT